MLAGGFSVTGYDISSRAADGAAAMGVSIAESTNEVFGACRIVVLSLPTTEVVERVLADAAGRLTSGHLIVDTTTGDPDRMAAIGSRLLERRVQYLDAPIAASSAQVLAGDAIVMVGGDSNAFQA